MDAVLNGYRSELLEKDAHGNTYEAAGPIVWGERLNGETASRTSQARLPTGKGTWIMHMLRRRMGDEAFFKLLAELRRRYGVQARNHRRLSGSRAANCGRGA